MDSNHVERVRRLKAGSPRRRTLRLHSQAPGEGAACHRIRYRSSDPDVPCDIFWDTRYAGKVGVLDEYRDTIGMALLRNGGTDFSSTDQAEVGRGGFAGRVDRSRDRGGWAGDSLRMVGMGALRRDLARSVS